MFEIARYRGCSTLASRLDQDQMHGYTTSMILIVGSHVFGLMAFCSEAYWASLVPRKWGFYFSCHMETRQSGLDAHV